jgi:integrase
MARKPKKLPDYFTTDEARALVTAAPSYPTRMAMRIMLRAGLRVSECLSLCAADLGSPRTRRSSSSGRR